MVKNLLLFSLMLLSSAVFAQLSIDITAPTIHGEGGVDRDITVRAEVRNTSNQDINLLWTRHEIAKPTIWETLVGDHSPNTDIAPDDKAILIPPGATVRLDISARTFGQAGYAQVELDLYDAVNQDLILGVVKATFEATNANSKSAAKRKEAIRIYPNPTTDYFRIYQSDGVSRIEVYNIVGKRIVSYPASLDGRYDVTNLQDGMYLVRLLAADKSVIKTVRLSKS